MIKQLLLLSRPHVIIALSTIYLSDLLDINNAIELEAMSNKYPDLLLQTATYCCFIESFYSVFSFLSSDMTINVEKPPKRNRALDDIT